MNTDISTEKQLQNNVIDLHINKLMQKPLTEEVKVKT